MKEICPGKEGHTEKIADPFARANGSRDARVNPAGQARVIK